MGMGFLWESQGKRPMGWDGTGINCYGMGMGQINMSHGQPCECINVNTFALKTQVLALHNKNMNNVKEGYFLHFEDEQTSIYLTFGKINCFLDVQCPRYSEHKHETKV